MRKYSTDEIAVLGLMLSIFISLYATAVAMLLVLVYLKRQSRLRGVFGSVSGANYVWALCALGFFIAYIYQNMSGMLIALGMGLIFYMAVYVRSVMTRSLFEKMLNLGCFASIFAFIVALVQCLVSGGVQFRPASVFENANYYATVVEFVVLFCVYKLCAGQDRKHKVYYGLVIAVNLTGLYLSNCRTAIFVLAVAVPLMLLLNKKYKAFFALVGAGIVAVLTVFLFPELFPRGEAMGEDFQIRLSIWKTALEGIRQHPLMGQGGATYTQIYAFSNGYKTTHAHSLYLDPLLNFGIIGTTLLVLFVWHNIRPIWQMRKTRRDRDRFVLGAAVMASVLVHGLFDITVLGLQTGLLLGMILAVAGIREREIPGYLENAGYPALYPGRIRQAGSALVRQFAPLHYQGKPPKE